MSVGIETIKDQVGKNVLLTVEREGNPAEQLEGKIEVASAAGVGFKPKGKRELELIEPSEVTAIEPAPEAEAKIKQAKLKPIEPNRVKKHLADRHGAPLSQVNPLTVEAAVELHDKIDHSDLGHNHNKVDAPDDASDSEDEAA